MTNVKIEDESVPFVKKKREKFLFCLLPLLSLKVPRRRPLFLLLRVVLNKDRCGELVEINFHRKAEVLGDKNISTPP